MLVSQPELPPHFQEQQYFPVKHIAHIELKTMSDLSNIEVDIDRFSSKPHGIVEQKSTHCRLAHIGWTHLCKIRVWNIL